MVSLSSTPATQPLSQPSKARPVLHVEVEVGSKGSQPSILDPQLVTRGNGHNMAEGELSHVKAKSNIGYVQYAGLDHTEQLESIHIADITAATSDELCINLADVDLDVQVFELHSYDDGTTQPNCDGAPAEESDLPEAKVTRLPNRALHGIWDSLIFDEPIPTRLLHFTTRMQEMMKRCSGFLRSSSQLQKALMESGTGKTSLCQALAQKLSIRLSKQYGQTKLIEIHCHSLFSKYFSESGKLVAKMFASIESILDERDTFLYVLIDEIESLASAREHNIGGSEPRDSLRAVNVLLTALDRLRSRSNVLVLCTSNLIEAMDPAFLDRVDLKQYVPGPCAKARYEIYRMCYLELSQCGIIAPVHYYDEGVASMVEGAGECESPGTVTFESGWHVLDDDLMPAHDIMQLRYWSKLDSPARILWDIAEKSKNLSGRISRRLPALAMALHTNSDPCSIEDALEALSRAVDEELLSKDKSDPRR
ncbi:hypothetical protein MMC24_004916 [Lignoscripta atroalba]|nr:hypothetical protein [Lignoscripta atroalba]